MFVEGCDETTCGQWGACNAACNVQGTETRDCTDPRCGVTDEQRPCTGPCTYFLFFPTKSVKMNLIKIDSMVSF